MKGFGLHAAPTLSALNRLKCASSCSSLQSYGMFPMNNLVCMAGKAWAIVSKFVHTIHSACRPSLHKNTPCQIQQGILCRSVQSNKDCLKWHDRHNSVRTSSSPFSRVSFCFTYPTPWPKSDCRVSCATSKPGGAP